MTDQKGITCPICEMTSYNPNDAEKRYCGHCNVFHGSEDAFYLLMTKREPDHARLIWELAFVQIEVGVGNSEALKIGSDRWAAAMHRLYEEDRGNIAKAWQEVMRHGH